MPRPEKVQAVADIRERIEGARAVFLAEYAGLSVKDQQDLRRSLRENGAEFKVVKMTMARLAAAELDIDTLDELLLGPTGLAFADDDPAGAAKVLKDFAKSHETFAVKGGLLGLEFLPPEKIAELADLEPRDVLLAKIAGVMQAPMANLAGLLAALPRNTANALQQLLEQKEAASSDEEDADATASAEDVAEEADDATETAASDEAEAEEASADEVDASPDEVEEEPAEDSKTEEADEASASADDAVSVSDEAETDAKGAEDSEPEEADGASASADDAVSVSDEAETDAKGAEDSEPEETDDDQEPSAAADDEE